MSLRMRFQAAVVFCLLISCAAPAFALATFGVSVESSIGANVGVAELTGGIVLTVVSGSTVTSKITIHYSAPITNNTPNEILTTGTGGLVTLAPFPTINYTNNTIEIDVPAGGGVGSQISVNGVRVSLVNYNEARVIATLTGSANGNAITAGQSIVSVMDAILTPFSVNLKTDSPLSWRGGVVLNPATSVLITEGYISAFTSSRNYGQTTSTRFRITPFPNVPDGVNLTFFATATSTETAATLTTTSGLPETVPRLDGTTAVEYVYTGTLPSPEVLESFRVVITAAVTVPNITGTVTFQTTLLPMGIDQPNAQFPSTDIPRYAELSLPDETDLLTGTTELSYPFRKKTEGTFTGVAITNPLPYKARVTLTAYDLNGAVIAGPDITNPVVLILPRRGQYARVATEIFGASFNVSTLGSIRVVGETEVLAGFYLIGDEQGSRLDGAKADINPKSLWWLPTVFHQGPSMFNIIEIFNPGTDAANFTLRLHAQNGVQLASSALLSVQPNGSMQRDMANLFPGMDLNSFEGGYFSGNSNQPLVVRETFGNDRDSNVLNAQSVLQLKSFPVTHFASGGGFVTEFTILNTDPSQSAKITLTLRNETGATLAIDDNPVVMTIQPHSQLIRSVRELFPALDSALTTGSVQINIEPINVGPFSTTPPIVGSVRFSSEDGFASAALPLFIAPATDLVYSHIAQNQGYYTGVALLNSSANIITVTLEAFTAAGTSLGYHTTTLLPGQKFSKLLYQLIPATQELVGGYIRVTSSKPIVSFALFGTTDGKSLSAIPPQIVN